MRGVTRFGSGAFASVVSNDGEIVLDNGTTDTPGIAFANGNNTNGGIDVSGGLIRFISNMNESGGAVRASISLSTGAVFGGTYNGNTITTGTGTLTLGTGTNNLTGLTVGGGTNMVRVKHGTATLVAGTVTVSDSTITANSRIFVNRFTAGGTRSASYDVTRTASTSFTVTGYDGAGAAQTADTSVVAYQIIEP
jgi:hypothetical protein